MNDSNLNQAIRDLDRMQAEKMGAARLAGGFQALDDAVAALNDNRAKADRAATKAPVENGAPRISDAQVKRLEQGRDFVDGLGR